MIRASLWPGKIFKLYHHRGTVEIINIGARHHASTAATRAASSSSHRHLKNRSTIASPGRLCPWYSCFMGSTEIKDDSVNNGVEDYRCNDKEQDDSGVGQGTNVCFGEMS